MRYQSTFSITESGDIQIPVVLKERHFLEEFEPERAVVQATGRRLVISIWSPRDMVEVWLPLTEWYATRPYGRSLSSGRVNVNRWLDVLDTNIDGGNIEIRGDIHVHDTDWTLKHPENI